MKAKELYHVGLYLRLSRDDASPGGRPESDSISSQRELCRAFVRRQKDMEIYDIYVDDADIIGLNQKTFDLRGFTD